MTTKRIQILHCRGIGEPLGENMLRGTTHYSGLPDLVRKGDHLVRTVEVPWNATYGPAGAGTFFGDDYATNLSRGMLLLDEMVRAAYEQGSAVILTGYSAGATLAGNYAAAVAAADGPALLEHHHALQGVGLVADPMRPVGGGTSAHVAPDYGIGGARDIPAHRFPVWWVADPRDPITSLPSNSPLRTIADQTYAMSFAPGEFPEWIGDLLDRLRERRWQPVEVPWWNIPAITAQYREAGRALGRYLFGRDHTSYDRRTLPDHGNVTYLGHLAEKISERIEKL